jgi:hypothetical protein
VWWLDGEYNSPKNWYVIYEILQCKPNNHFMQIKEWNNSSKKSWTIFEKLLVRILKKIIQMLGHGLASQESCNPFKSNEPIQEPNLLGLHGLGGS